MPDSTKQVTRLKAAVGVVCRAAAARRHNDLHDSDGAFRDAPDMLRVFALSRSVGQG